MKPVVQFENTLQSQRISELCGDIMFALNSASNQIMIRSCFGWKLNATGLEAISGVLSVFFPNDPQVINNDSASSVLRSACNRAVDIWAGVNINGYIPNEDELYEALIAAKSIDETSWFEPSGFRF